MKRPEDKLESLYQERLRQQERPVDQHLWERVQDRVGHGRKRKGPFFWWFLGFLAMLTVVGIGWALLETKEESGSNKEEHAIAKKGEGSEENQKKSSKPSEEKGRSHSEAKEVEKKNGSALGKEQEEREEKDENDQRGEKKTSEGERNVEEAEQVNPEKKEGKEKPLDQKETQGTPEKSEAQDENASRLKKASASGKENSRHTTKESSSNEEQEKKASGSQANEQDSEPKRTDKGERSKTASKQEEEKKKASTERQEKEIKEDRGSSGQSEQAEKSSRNREPREELSLMAPKIPEAEAIQKKELDSMGREPEKIDISKGAQPIETFFVRGIGSYGSSYRDLRGLRGEKLADHRNANESSINSFSYGIETGVRWSNGLEAGLGVERNLFGSDFSFSDSKLIRDSSYSTDTNKTYIDSITDITFDSICGCYDTTTVIIDSNETYDTDTSVTERDSSYKQEYSIRYRYVSVPITFSYRFEVGDRLAIVPTLGFGLNFLTRARAGWSEPESHKEVRLRYPPDPPFRRFALSFRGRLSLRYQLGSDWEIGAGFRYSKFLHSIYTDDMRIDERPYRYGGSFSVTYLLGN